MSLREVGSQHKSEQSPNYSVFSTEFLTSIAVALALVAINMVLIIGFADTPIAAATMWLYTDAPLAPFAGLLVFGGALTIGRGVGLKAMRDEKLGLSIAMAALVQVAYGAFAGGIITGYASGVAATAIFITLAGTTGYMLLVSAVVYATDISFEPCRSISGFLMIGGVISVFLTSIIGVNAIALLGFALITLGFMVDMIYEIWHTSNKHISPVFNGFAVYIAFMGVFVHVLQLVLEALANE